MNIRRGIRWNTRCGSFDRTFDGTFDGTFDKTFDRYVALGKIGALLALLKAGHTDNLALAKFFAKNFEEDAAKVCVWTCVRTCV